MENKYNFYFTEVANLDMAEIIDYISNNLDNAKAALNFLDSIENAIENITTFPDSGTLSEISTLHKLGIRKILIGNFIMFYEIDHNAKSITILRIRYGKSDLSQF